MVIGNKSDFLSKIRNIKQKAMLKYEIYPAEFGFK